MNYKKLIFSALMLFSVGVYAQSDDQPKVGDAFQFRTPFGILQSNHNGLSFGQEETAPQGSSFNIVNITEDSYVISFWDWNANTNPTKRATFNYNAVNGNHLFFIIPKKDFLVTTRVYKKWSPVLGILTFPFKYRPQTGVFEKTFSLSIAGGFNRLFSRINPDHSFAFTAAVGASSATLTPDNTRYDSGITENTDKAAVTLSFNVIYIFERLQIAGSIGIDNLLDGGNKIGWDYNGRGWFSLGIGANIFSQDKGSKATGGDQPH